MITVDEANWEAMYILILGTLSAILLVCNLDVAYTNGANIRRMNEQLTQLIAMAQEEQQRSLQPDEEISVTRRMSV